MSELSRIVRSQRRGPYICNRPTVERKVVITIQAYPTLSEKNPKLIATGECECGRIGNQHTFDCITVYLDSRDPKCGCDKCHVVGSIQQ
jgi:hypothetical protein